MKDPSPNTTLRIAEFLGTLFSDPGAPIPPDADALAKEAHNVPLLYWFGSQRNAPASKERRQAFQAATLVQMKNKLALDSFYQRLEEEKIPFVPIKGIDLAFRIFPSAALRLSTDWDIWIRPADYKRLRSLLKKDGWKCPIDCPSDHHWSGWVKHDSLLEPHFSLPNFPGVSAKELWNLVDAPSNGSMQKHLPAPLALLLLFQHNSSTFYMKSNLLKLLIDTEFLLRSEPMDWTQVSKLAQKWRLPHPALLLDAFPEFFRGRWNSGITFPDEIISALRTQLLLAESYTPHPSDSGIAETKFLDPSWIWSRLKHLNRDCMQLRFPQMGPGPLSYCRCLCIDFYRKVQRQIRGKHSPEVQSLLERKKRIGLSWQYAPNCNAPDRRAASTSHCECNRPQKANQKSK